MAFTEFETSTANISGLSDRPNQNDGLSSAQLKGRFDKAGNDIKTYINDVLLEELERTTDGDSGADNIGATAVGDGTATTVQGVLEEIDAKVVTADARMDKLARTTDGDSGADNIGATAVGDGTATTVQGVLEEIDADVTALNGAVVHKTGNETIAGVKTFTDSPIVPAPTADTNPATKKYVDDTDATAVHKTGDETITGTKTFSTAPVVPTPTTDTNPATKKYVDDFANALKRTTAGDSGADNIGATAVGVGIETTVQGI